MERISHYVIQIAKLFHINKILYKLNKSIITAHKPVVELPDEASASQLLEKIHPDPKSSCYSSHQMTHSHDLTIIVPVFNVERYIKECIESIVKQKTTFDYRVIIINDGSTDASGEILKEYESNCNIQIIHQSNKGLSGARNVGLMLVDSKYIMFLDSDDFLLDNAVQALLEAAYSKNADIVEGGYLKIDVKGKIIKKIPHESGTNTAFYGQPWGKVYKSELFKNVCFPDNYWYEDSIMAQIIYPMSAVSWSISDAVYAYRRNPAGITSVSKIKIKSIDSLYITKQLFEDRKKYGLENNRNYYNYILRMVKQTYSRTSNLAEDIKKAIFVCFSEFITKNFNEFSAESTDFSYKELERIIQAKDYGAYKLYCTWL